MNKDYILSVIKDYADEYLKVPQRRLSRGDFEQRSYQRWAVDEILRAIEKSNSAPPIVAVEDFIRKMDEFSCKNHRTSIIFSVAYDVATDILDLLIAMK